MVSFIKGPPELGSLAQLNYTLFWPKHKQTPALPAGWLTGWLDGWSFWVECMDG